MRFLLCFVVAAFALVSCSKISSPGVEVDAKLKSYILPKSKVLAGVDLDKIKQSPFYLQQSNKLQIPQLNELAEQTGMDPRRDFSSVLMSWDGTGTLVMTRGSFSPDQLEKRLGGITKSEPFHKLTLYGDGKFDVVFLPKGVALLGSAVQLKRAVSESSGTVPEGLQAQLALLAKGTQIWEVSSGVIPLEQLSLRSDAASALSNISGYINGSALGVTFGTGVALDARISCISTEGSQRVNDALRGVIGLARLSTPDNQMDQLKIWDSIKVEKHEKEVHVTADLPAAVAQKLLDLVPSVTRHI